MSKKPDYQLEYVYTKSQFKRTLWWCLGIYVLLRILRAVLYFTVGVAFMSSIPAAFLFFFTGMVWGVAALAIWRYRKSVRLDDIEAERERLQNKNQ
jgi:lipopolysaccharide/colanic/teichoic acid biosynthesis glycosyltransferase